MRVDRDLNWEGEAPAEPSSSYRREWQKRSQPRGSAGASPSQALAAVLLAASLLGCRDDGPARYDLSGAVTFAGQPVPGGEIIFTPDASQGNAGPGCVAMIKDGRYETFVGKGTVGGPHVITVTGYKDIPGSVPDDQLQAMFPPTQLKLELPASSGKLDIDVPKS